MATPGRQLDDLTGQQWNQLDLIKRSRNLSRRGQMLELYDSGLTIQQIAARMGVYEASVQVAVHDHLRDKSEAQALAEPHPDLPDGWSTMPLTYFVYALGASAVKIGYTNVGLSERLRGLSTGCPFELIPAAVILGGMRNETKAHKRLFRHRLRGEWFDAHVDVWEYAERHGVFVYHHWLEPWSDVFDPAGPCEQIGEDIGAHTAAIWADVRKAFDESRINAREREVLCMRFGLSETCEELTLAQAGSTPASHQRTHSPNRKDGN